jgi:hypothetical protein
VKHCHQSVLTIAYVLYLLPVLPQPAILPYRPSSREKVRGNFPRRIFQPTSPGRTLKVVDWERRNRVFLLGAPLAVVPAVAFLPLFTYVVIGPASPATPPALLHPWSALIFSTLVLLWMFGSVLIGFAGFRRELSFVTLFAVATVVFLLVVAAYTGLFFAVFAGRM